jgi:hypothetical protein
MKLFRRIPKNSEPITLSHNQLRFLLGKQFVLGILLGFIIRELLIRF